MIVPETKNGKLRDLDPDILAIMQMTDYIGLVRSLSDNQSLFLRESLLRDPVRIKEARALFTDASKKLTEVLGKEKGDYFRQRVFGQPNKSNSVPPMNVAFEVEIVSFLRRDDVCRSRFEEFRPIPPANSSGFQR